MSRHSWLCCLVLCCAAPFAGDAVSAAVEAADPLLAALIADAIDASSEIEAAEAEAAGAGQRPAQLRALSAPMLSVLYVNDGIAPTLGEMDMTTLGLMASQDLPVAGVRTLQADIAASEATEASLRAERS